MRSSFPKLSAVALLLLLSFFVSAAWAQTTSRNRQKARIRQSTPRKNPEPDPNLMKQLNTYVEQLQNTPEDQGLRETIIKLAVTIKPAPPIPAEARRHFLTGA